MRCYRVRSSPSADASLDVLWHVRLDAVPLVETVCWTANGSWNAIVLFGACDPFEYSLPVASITLRFSLFAMAIVFVFLLVMPFPLFVSLFFGPLGLAFQIDVFIGTIPLPTGIGHRSPHTARKAAYFPDRIGLSRTSVSELLLPCRFLCEREGRTSSPEELPGKFPCTQCPSTVSYAYNLSLFSFAALPSCVASSGIPATPPCIQPHTAKKARGSGSGATRSTDLGVDAV